MCYQRKYNNDIQNVFGGRIHNFVTDCAQSTQLIIQTLLNKIKSPLIFSRLLQGEYELNYHHRFLGGAMLFYHHFRYCTMTSFIGIYAIQWCYTVFLYTIYILFGQIWEENCTENRSKPCDWVVRRLGQYSLHVLA